MLQSGTRSRFAVRLRPPRSAATISLCALLGLLTAGCSRDRNWFRREADDQAFSILDEKTQELSLIHI